MKHPLLLLLGALALPLGAAEFQASWQGSRPWIGPEYWASPLYDWETKNGTVEANAATGRLLQLLSHRVTQPGKGFSIRTEVELLLPGSVSLPDKIWAGFAVGVRGQMDDPRHVAVWPSQRLNAGLRADGRLLLGADTLSQDALPGAGPVALRLTAEGGNLVLTGTRGDRTVSVSKPVAPPGLLGNICLAAESPRKAGDPRGEIRARFRSWQATGPGLTETGVKPFGPILWSQYTRQGNRVKLSVQMPPLGPEDPSEVTLEIRASDGGEWTPAGSAPIDPLARTAVFSLDLPAATGSWDYRARYPWQGRQSRWAGRFIEDPAVGATPLKLAVMSCDNGYAFPLPTLTRNVSIHNPNLLFFAGDQIYESYGGFGTIRQPVEKAMLDYLRKFYQFGWTWRELLKDRPSIIIPDDHDVFQGNLWGGGGRAVERQEQGGYVMPAAWVRAVERTQTGHLPDPVDPTPVAQGIGVYFTQLKWGGVPMAVLEDRKWKSGPAAVLPANRNSLGAAGTDVKGASLLGERQEHFLTNWAAATRDEPLRLVLSQTIFCKGHTHSGPALTKSRFDWDSNGWPRSGRQRALTPLIGGHTVMLHGDQHLGLLARHGVNTWNDGPWAFMVPGTANGFPRAWWPDDGRITGDFTDPFGNQFTVIAAANPERGSNSLKPLRTDPPERTAQLKGSGYGMVIVPPDRKSARFEMWRYDFDASHPAPGAQFPGFPQTLQFDKN